MAGLTIVIAAYNEGGMIGEVVHGLRQRGYSDIVVVDDGSTDDTAQQALAAGAIVLPHPINLGQGAAIQTGLIYACAQDAEFIATFDADGQHCADDIDVLLARLQAEQADIVLGSRFLGAAIGMDLKKKLMLKAAILFTALTSGMKLTDAHNGFRVMTRRAAQVIRIRQNRMAHASEIIDQIRVNKLKYVEAPVTIVYSEYSIRKGQKIGNALNIIAELLVGKMFK